MELFATNPGHREKDTALLIQGGFSVVVTSNGKTLVATCG